MNIALFGGTFDPIHAGHLEAARAARRRFHLARILFIPTGNPPHKVHHCLTDYTRRYAMVALACAGERAFIPSALEAPARDGSPHYSIDTVRAARRRLGPRDRLFFLVGADAFLDLPHWKDFQGLLDLTEFIVVTRPGFDLDLVPWRRGAVHILRGVATPIASRDIRRAARAGQSLAGVVPKLVEEYILKEGLYRSAAGEKNRS